MSIEVSVMLLMTVGNMDFRRIIGNVYLDLKPSGEPFSGKPGRWVRRGLLEKVPPIKNFFLFLLEVTRLVATLPYPPNRGGLLSLVEVRK